MYQNLSDRLRKKESSIAIIGLGYVGLPLACEFSKYFKVLGFDINSSKIDAYKKGIDPTGEIERELKNYKIEFSSNETDIKKASFIIVAIPTPVDKDNNPDLSILKNACVLVGKNLSKGSIIVFESTVAPGTTEDICVDIIAKESGLKAGEDFKIGYSPERINPGDKNNRLSNIVKVVSAQDEETLNIVADIYSTIVNAGIYKAESIKVAEAAKIIENAQRDINIAFINEVAQIFDRLGISTKEVLAAASTKWNFLNFTPGLVGGHCIGVDPYYLAQKAKELGINPQIILSGRNINENIANFIAKKTLSKLLVLKRRPKILIMGITFKENVPDIRNSKVIDIVDYLKGKGAQVIIFDPIADAKEVKSLYNIDMQDIDDIDNIDAVVVTVAHQAFKNYKLDYFIKKFSKDSKVFIDVKSIFNKKYADTLKIDYWSL